jgi:hypothetical protein
MKGRIVVLLSVAATLTVVVVGLAAYVLAHGSRVSQSEALTAGQAAERAAYAAAWTTGEARGKADGYGQGVAAGRDAGQHHGSHAGRRAGLAARAKRLAAAAAERATSTGSCPPGLVPQGTAACVKPGTESVGGESAGCGGNPYATPDRFGGCIGPAHPPSSGPAKECPPGWVPAGQTGACAPAESEAEPYEHPETPREMEEAINGG